VEALLESIGLRAKSEGPDCPPHEQLAKVVGVTAVGE